MTDEVTTVSEIDPRAAYIKPADRSTELREKIVGALELDGGSITSVLSALSFAELALADAERERDELLKKSDWTPRYQSMLARVESAEKEAQSAEAKLAEAVKVMEAIRDYPKAGRTTEDGYPSEIVYDEFAYKRMVDSYRATARSFLASIKGGEDAEA